VFKSVMCALVLKQLSYRCCLAFCFVAILLNCAGCLAKKAPSSVLRSVGNDLGLNVRAENVAKYTPDFFAEGSPTVETLEYHPTEDISSFESKQEWLPCDSSNDNNARSNQQSAECKFVIFKSGGFLYTIIKREDGSGAILMIKRDKQN